MSSGGRVGGRTDAELLLEGRPGKSGAETAKMDRGPERTSTAAPGTDRRRLPPGVGAFDVVEPVVDGAFARAEQELVVTSDFRDGEEWLRSPRSVSARPVGRSAVGPEEADNPDDDADADTGGDGQPATLGGSTLADAQGDERGRERVSDHANGEADQQRERDAGLQQSGVMLGVVVVTGLVGAVGIVAIGILFSLWFDAFSTPSRTASTRHAR